MVTGPNLDLEDDDDRDNIRPGSPLIQQEQGWVYPPAAPRPPVAVLVMVEHQELPGQQVEQPEGPP